MMGQLEKTMIKNKVTVLKRFVGIQKTKVVMWEVGTQTAAVWSCAGL